MRHLFIAFAVAVALVAVAPRVAQAGEIQVAVGLAGAKTDWRGDGAAYGTLKLGYRWKDIFALYVAGRFGYGVVDQRLLTYLGLGAQLWGRLGIVRPFVRLALIHQHEEPVVAAAKDPGGVLLGVGDGIRHRTGLELGLGIDIPFFRRKTFELFTTVEATGAWVTYSSGPSWFLGGGLALGLNYGI